MKRTIHYSLIMALAFAAMSLYPNGAAYNGQGDRTASPIAKGTCGSSGCHSGGNFNPVTTIQLLDSLNNVVTKYIPGANYTFKISVTGTGSKQYGFQATALSDSNSNAGVFSNLPVTVRSVNLVDHTVVEHKVPSSAGVWSFKWTAPSSNLGVVNFYACGLATNQNGSNTGDQADTSYLKLDQLSFVSDIDHKIFDYKIEYKNNQQLSLILDTDRNINLKAEIINSMGQIVISKNLFANQGISFQDIDIKILAKGIYYVCLNNKEERIVKKFIKY